MRKTIDLDLTPLRGRWRGVPEPIGSILPRVLAWIVHRAQRALAAGRGLLSAGDDDPGLLPQHAKLVADSAISHEVAKARVRGSL